MRINDRVTIIAEDKIVYWGYDYSLAMQHYKAEINKGNNPKVEVEANAQEDWNKLFLSEGFK